MDSYSIVMLLIRIWLHLNIECGSLNKYDHQRQMYVPCAIVSYRLQYSNICVDSISSVPVQRSSKRKRLQAGIAFVSRGRREEAFSGVPVPRATRIALLKSEKLSFAKP